MTRLINELSTWFLDMPLEHKVPLMAYSMIVAGLISFVLLFGINGPYGRYSPGASTVWGPKINGKIAWCLQESPCVVMVIYWLWHIKPQQLLAWPNRLLIGAFFIHYFNRTFIFPLRLRGGKDTPFSIFLIAFLFCLFNGYMQCFDGLKPKYKGLTRVKSLNSQFLYGTGKSFSLYDVYWVRFQSVYLTQIAVYDDGYVMDPRFLGGLLLFFTGMGINIQADNILISLRKPGETGYKIPKGGMFEYVSGANFFGEILEWTGFAIASWSLIGGAFAIFTFCNIAPRGWQHHQWYIQKFKGEYPKTRRAVIPFIW